jgi:hypothetical protein
MVSDRRSAPSERRMKTIDCAACRRKLPKFNIVRGMCSPCYARDMRSRKRIKAKALASAAEPS